jgi:hypothetical protein
MFRPAHVNGASTVVTIWQWLCFMHTRMFRAQTKCALGQDQRHLPLPEKCVPLPRLYPDSVPTPSLDRPVSDVDRSAFMRSLLQTKRQCALTWLLSPEPHAVLCKVPTVRQVVSSSNCSAELTPAQVADIVSKLSVSKEQIESVEVSTSSEIRCGVNIVLVG